MYLIPTNFIIFMCHKNVLKVHIVTTLQTLRMFFSFTKMFVLYENRALHLLMQKFTAPESTWNEFISSPIVSAFSFNAFERNVCERK